MKEILDTRENKIRATKLAGAAALLFNGPGELLIVKSPYKDYWTLPGGGIEENESPRMACTREAKEEVNVDIADPVFLCVDYQNTLEKDGTRRESFQFLFHGGTLTDEQVKQIKLQEEEISEIKFVSIPKAQNLVGKLLAKRLPKCVEAYENGEALYLENAD